MDAHASEFLEHHPSPTNRSIGPIIEELNSDDEKIKEIVKEKKENPRKHARSSKKPYVEDPDDEGKEQKSKMQFRNDFNIVNNTQSQTRSNSFTFQSSTITYGGANGACYTLSKTRRAGSDGLTFEEFKEADSATGQAAHRVSKGIHDKGHSVMRKLNSDGRGTRCRLCTISMQMNLPVLKKCGEGALKSIYLAGMRGFACMMVWDLVVMHRM